MKYTLILAAFAAVAVEGQKDGAAPKAKGKCEYTKDVKSFPDPTALFPPGSAVFPCDMGSAVPLGKVPTGCAQLEIIYGKYLSPKENLVEFINESIKARGTSEPGDFGVICGDPLIARVKRDLPGVSVRGYPVQVHLLFGILSNSPC
jgi:hypothetical protein